MKNKLKIAALVAVVVIGMIVYKKVVDERETKPAKKDDDLN